MLFKSQEDNTDSFNVKMNSGNFELDQNVQAYVDYAKASREDSQNSKAGEKYRSFAIIPDIVAIDIKTKHGLDIHHPEFMSNPLNMRKYKALIRSEYPHLLTSQMTRR